MERTAEFTERERLMLELLRLHLLQAHRNALAFGRMQRRLDQLVRQVGTHLVNVDRRGRITFATSHALACLETYVGAGRAGGLPQQLEAWRTMQARRLSDDHDDALHDAPRVLEPSSSIGRAGRRLVVRYVVDDDGSLLLIEERATAPCADDLRALGLTHREAQVLALIAAGNTSTGTGEVLGLSLRTVEKHLEHVYAKLGVPNRASAVALAMGGAISS